MCLEMATKRCWRGAAMGRRRRVVGFECNGVSSRPQVAGKVCVSRIAMELASRRYFAEALCARQHVSCNAPANYFLSVCVALVARYKRRSSSFVVITRRVHNLARWFSSSGAIERSDASSFHRITSELI